MAATPPAKDTDDVPDDLKPTVILGSYMVKVKVAPVVDEEDREDIQEKLAELLSDDNFANVVNYFFSDEENLKELGFTADDAALIEENVVYEVSD